MNGFCKNPCFFMFFYKIIQKKFKYYNIDLIVCMKMKALGKFHCFSMIFKEIGQNRWIKINSIGDKEDGGHG